MDAVEVESGGGVLRAVAAASDGPAVLWLTGSPGSGAIAAPLTAARPDLRWFSFDRPGYGGSTRRPGRDVASVAADALRVADALGIDRFAAVGYSGGAPHVLALAALAGDRVSAAAVFASPAPFTGEAAWFDGMAPSGRTELGLAREGAAPLEAHLKASDFDAGSFTASDLAALGGPWGVLGGDGEAAGIAGLVDDDVAFVTPWGVALEAIVAPVLLLQGGADRIVPAHHSDAIAAAIPHADLFRYAADGHVSVLTHLDDALAWLSRPERLPA